ncbi:SDR family oxidoreductase, partial [bacterium]|nr:SDR family oxidoreductase [bacterium]
PIRVDNPDTVLSLVYIDDVIDEFIDYLVNTPDSANVYKEVNPVYSISLADLSSQIKNFKESTPALTIGNVGSGFARALYSTYISYLPVENFSYSIPEHSDDRGSFVEILKTDNNGQFSFFTAHPGVTRGGHYHHTKNEKFLVVKGRARFRFCHISTGEFHEIVTEDSQPKIVNTIPGWAHDITNIGDSDLVAVLWSNEIFDQNKPDTYIFEMD